ncbi:MAG TPA: DUF2784 domain-containing protein [Thermodesulfobacteriota bacterium]|nr:DUF2784 domain-containing protein [Thermodesulfobacteriota bacterium]
MNGYGLLADLVLVVHFGFVAFVVLGALLARGHRRLQALHLLAATYAVGVAAVRWVCPLTSLEYWLRARAGQPVDGRGFLARLLEPVLYGWADLQEGLVLAGAVLILAGSLLLYLRPTAAGASPGSGGDPGADGAGRGLPGSADRHDPEPFSAG